MKRAGALITAGLLGAVVIHIVIVLVFPAVGGRDLWIALDGYGPPSQFTTLPPSTPDTEAIAYLDPAMLHAVCRVDLAAGAHRITADTGASYWSLGVLNRRGRSLYGLNSGSAGGTAVDLLLISSDELAGLREDPPAILDEVIVVELDADAVIVVLRAFVGDATRRDIVAAQLANAACLGPVEIEPEIEPASEEPVLPVQRPEDVS